ncbi:terminase large subunit domain-containing protein [Bradyrhizobium cenepequi]|uniref:terminase large subunit domain-containing protein n=1 Tax=Bradyrhizobium cenepequi TaxID=2821403 RepID=UPI001CE27CC6|nr:terminase family protein [Bradyrhizobium cenepequi]MCA6106108.1 hypothetical protein [Bradyrhizobium cenepequi]
MKQKKLVRERLDPDHKPAPRSKLPPKPAFTLLHAIDDPKLFAQFFPNPESWIAWRAFIAAAFGLSMSDEELAIYQQCTGRTDPPTQQARECVLVIGRRGGKSRILALIAVWLACFHDYRQYLDEGELGVVQVLAADKDQARVILRYTKGLIKNVPMLSRMIERETQHGLELSNSISIEITTSSFRTVRGRTIVGAACDEIAWWQSEDSSNPDVEVVNAIRPGMATIPTSMLLLASSPYARRGVLYNMHRQYHGKDDPRVLCWQAATDVMNREIDPAFIAEQYERDAVSASAEYGAQFRSDLEAFVSREAVEACIIDGRHELMPSPGIKYVGFIDAAGGTGQDSFCLGIAHREGDIGVLDVLRETRPPFSTDDVVKEYCEVLKSFGVNFIVGDGYAGGFVVYAFAKHGVRLEQSAKRKSAIYAEFLPMLNSKRVQLLDNERMILQFTALERSTARGSSRETIDHPPRGGHHDDLCNSAAGAIVHLSTKRYKYDASLQWVGGPSERSNAAERLSGFLTMRGV